MPFIYCTECGYKNVFTTRKAKFCAGCGQSFEEEEANRASAASPQSAQGNSQNDPSEGIPNIQKLEYTIDLENKPPTIGDLINTKDEGSERPERPEKSVGKVSKASTREEIEAESMRECGSSKNHSVD
jgi:hypothetical protein